MADAKILLRGMGPFPDFSFTQTEKITWLQFNTGHFSFQDRLRSREQILQLNAERPIDLLLQ